MTLHKKTTSLFFVLTFLWTAGPSVTHAQEPKELHVLKGHTKGVRDMRFSPNGKRLAVACGDGNVKTWDVSSGAEAQPIEDLKINIDCLYFCADNDTVIAGGSLGDNPLLARASFVSWRAENGGTPASPQSIGSGRTHVSGIMRSGKDFLISGYNAPSRSGEVALWNADDGKFVWRHAAKPFFELHFLRSVVSPNGKAVGIRSEEDLLIVESDTGKRIRSLPIKFEVSREYSGEMNYESERRFTFSHDNSILAFSRGSRESADIELWEIRSGKLQDTLAKKNVSVKCVVFSPDGKRLATGATEQKGFADSEPILVIWDVEKGTERFVVRGLRKPVNCLVYSPNGKMLALGGEDTRVTVLDLSADKEGK